MANGAMDRRYALASQQMRRQEQQQSEKEKEALRRRFAAQGGLGSGASIKAEQVAGQESAKRLGQAESQLEMSRLGEQARQEEIEQARSFQRGEREAGQTFAGTQAELGRKFATSERLGGQEFAGTQAELGRKFTTSERMGAQEFAGTQASKQMEFAREQNRMNRNLQQQGIDLQKQELAINKLSTLFNMKGDSANWAREQLTRMLGGHPWSGQVSYPSGVSEGGNVMPSFNTSVNMN